jgi:hypothetical protein
MAGCATEFKIGPGVGYVQANFLAAPDAVSNSMLNFVVDRVFILARAGLPKDKQQEREEIKVNPETFQIHDLPLLSARLIRAYAWLIGLSNFGFSCC